MSFSRLRCILSSPGQQVHEDAEKVLVLPLAKRLVLFRTNSTIFSSRPESGFSFHSEVSYCPLPSGQRSSFRPKTCPSVRGHPQGSQLGLWVPMAQVFWQVLYSHSGGGLPPATATWVSPPMGWAPTARSHLSLPPALPSCSLSPGPSSVGIRDSHSHAIPHPICLSSQARFLHTGLLEMM